MSFPLPADLAERARELLAGRLRPVAPRDSATVMLMRDGTAGLEVYMLRRKRSMAFAAGAYVFPGGSVDLRDSDHAVAWAGPSAGHWGEIFGVGESLARALVCAAVRETFEESGVLLAGPAEDAVVEDTTGDGWEADRLALIDRSLAFAEFLDRRSLVLRSDLLHEWAQWITPVVEPKRFDTRFFAAAMPAGQRTRHVGGEADRVTWISPSDGLRMAEKGEIFLMPPTYATLRELAAYERVADVMAAPREIDPLLPDIAEVDGQVCLVMPVSGASL